MSLAMGGERQLHVFAAGSELALFFDGFVEIGQEHHGSFGVGRNLSDHSA